MAERPDWATPQATTPQTATPKAGRPDWATPATAEPTTAEPAERGVLDRAGAATAETFQTGLGHATHMFDKPEPGAMGALKNLGATGMGLLSPLTMTMGAATSGLASLGASALSPALRGTERAIASGVERYNPAYAEKLRKNIPTSEGAYEALKPGVETALGATGARGIGLGGVRAPNASYWGWKAPPLPARPAPPTGPFDVILSEGQATGALPAIKQEQAAMRAQAGTAPYEHARAFQEQQAGQVEAARNSIAAELDTLGHQAIASTPLEAGELASGAVTQARDIRKAAVDVAYEQARALPGEIHAGAFEGMPQHIKGDLTLAAEPVVIDNRMTPAASSMIDFLDGQIGRLRIQNKADPFGPPNPENITGISLNGIDRWRRNLSAIRRSAATPEDGRAARAVLDSFDERIDRAVNQGLFTGDPDAIHAWNMARAAHADYRSTFRGGPNNPVGQVVEKILGKGVQDPATPNEVMNFITGAGGNVPNNLSSAVTRRLKTIMGEASPEWAGVKQGVFRKLVETPEDVKDFGPGTVADRIGEFLNGKGKAVADEVFAPHERELVSRYGRLMRQLQVPQAGANWSNNSPMVEATMKVVKGIGTIVGGYIGHTMGHGILGAEAAGAAVGYTAAKAAEKIGQVAKARQLARQMPLIANQIKQWQRAVARAQSGSPTANVTAASQSLAHHLTSFGTPVPVQQWRQVVAQTQTPTGRGKKEEKKRYTGGRVLKTFRYAEGGAVPRDALQPTVEEVVAAARRREPPAYLQTIDRLHAARKRGLADGGRANGMRQSDLEGFFNAFGPKRR